MRLKAFRVTNYKTVMDSGRVEIDTNVACLMGKNESGKSAVMQALWKFNNVSGANYDRLLDIPAELYSRLRANDPDAVVLEFCLEEHDKTDLLKEVPDLGAAPNVITVRSSYDKKRNFEISLNYTPPSYNTISSHVKGTVSALTTLESSTPAEAAELQLILAARQALEELDVAGATENRATEIPIASIQTAITSLKAVPSAKLGDLGKETMDALGRFASHSQPDLQR